VSAPKRVRQGYFSDLNQSVTETADQLTDKDTIFSIWCQRSLLPMALEPNTNGTARIMLAGRSSSLSAQVVAEVRDALFAKRLRPGDFLGSGGAI
jgi:hypothetical protein